MNSIWRTVLLASSISLVAVTLPERASAQSVLKTEANGCGSGWNRYLVPDSIPIAQCDFRDSCDTHDVCYGRCEETTDGECQYRRCQEGGDLYKSPLCLTDRTIFESTRKAMERRRSCDNDFYNNLRRANPGKAACEAFAIVYKVAVKNFGANAFAGMGELGLVLRQDQEDYERQIREFFRHGSERDFQLLVEQFDAGTLKLNMRSPIRFRLGEGLSNE